MYSNQKSFSAIQDITPQFLACRQLSEELCQPLEIEDYGLQAVVETSPVKWHLAHTSWFFETFILKQFEIPFKNFNPKFEYLFNSYYNGVGEQYLRANRHLLSRPTVEEIYQYRRNVTERMVNLFNQKNLEQYAEIYQLTLLGINHEQQHQELLLTDLLYSWSFNPLFPQYQTQPLLEQKQANKSRWLKQEGRLIEIGADNKQAFYFDNETPRHKVHINPFKVANCLITNRQFLQFIEDSGYQRPEFWLSDGWATVNQNQWQAPLYWQKDGNNWYQYSLNGLVPLNMEAPVCHVSAYEADAYARWANARLLTEAEWEYLAQQQPIDGNFLESGLLVPAAANNSNSIEQLFGDVWEWTSSAYSAYSGFQASDGAIGEYNGKFMCNQLALRGGSCVTSRDHIRSSYRNFFYPDARWQFSGIRLAKNI